ncbi:MAG: hypothetical protein AAF378_16235 [Cyanobacteria bacterium P01_A01_bin.84]
MLSGIGKRSQKLQVAKDSDRYKINFYLPSGQGRRQEAEGRRKNTKLMCIASMPCPIWV